MAPDEIDKLKITTLLEDTSGQNTSFLSQHGLSFLVEVRKEEQSENILFDVGQSSYSIIHNMQLMDIDPNSIDKIFLSHCHYDHTGGLIGILKEIEGKNIPIIAHPDLFRPCFLKNPRKEIGMTEENTKEKIREHGGKLNLSEKPLELFPGVLSTGEIERTTDFEEITLETYTKRNGEIVKDQIPDDISLVIKIKNKGPLVLSGCSHPGIINIIKHSKKTADIEKVRYVVGGLHLVDANEEKIRKTVNSLKKHGVKKPYVGHCTGFKGEISLYRKFGKNFERLHSGKIIEIP